MTLLLAQLLRGAAVVRSPVLLLVLVLVLVFVPMAVPVPVSMAVPVPVSGVDRSREECLEVDDWAVPANCHVLKPRGQIAEQVVRMHGAASPGCIWIRRVPGRLVPHRLGVFELPIVLASQVERWMRVDHFEHSGRPCPPTNRYHKEPLGPRQIATTISGVVVLALPRQVAPLEQLFYRETSLARTPVIARDRCV